MVQLEISGIEKFLSSTHSLLETVAGSWRFYWNFLANLLVWFLLVSLASLTELHSFGKP